ncbi:hypothetical protein M3Y95_01112700 [Aphelenchoides besseyi]|nr:hypothetical protein M3Y95_01112700 [Aphelenchoides besseyi]
MDLYDVALHVHQIQPVFELTISLPSLIANIYFAIRFSKLECFSPSLRILLILSSIITSLSTIVHSIALLIPEKWYSVERGQYVGAFLVYGLHFLTMIFVIIVDSKFLLVSIERWYAFKHRLSYELNDNGNGAKKVLTIYLTIVAVIVSIKCACLFLLYGDETMDERLALSFIAERCIWLFVSNALLASTTWGLGAAHFVYLQFYTKRTQKDAKTLSERFQLKQCSNVANVMLPLLIAFAFGVLWSGSCMTTILYLYFIAGYSTKHVYYQAAYYSIPLYALHVTAYQCYYFRAMRRVIIQDLKTLFGIHVEDNSIYPMRNKVTETSMHFAELNQQWN